MSALMNVLTALFYDSYSLRYYDHEERLAAATLSRELGRSAGVAKSSTQAQREAKEFIAQLMGGDEVTEDGGNPTVEELNVLCSRVR